MKSQFRLVVKGLTTLLVLCAFPLIAYAFESDSLRKRFSVDEEILFGRMIKDSRYVRKFIKQDDNAIYHVSLGYRSLPSDSNQYASDFNYPTFSVGILVGDFHRVRMYKTWNRMDYQSRIGPVVGLYGAFNRKILTAGRFSMEYAFENGLAYGFNPYNPSTNVDNELIGSSFLFYFGTGFYTNYQINGHWEVSAGVGFRHLSNGALDRPNIGVNSVGIGLKTRYNFTRQPLRLPKFPQQPFYGSFYYNISSSIAGKALLEEWDLYYYKTPKDDPKYRTTHYKIYMAGTLSADAMYRYSRRYGSGIGSDVFYSPYADRIKEINDAAGKYAKYNRWSVGLALKHEVYYNNLALSMGIGYYLYREMGFLSVSSEKPYYERLGLKYYFPKFKKMFLGYHVKAHFVKADLMELCAGVQL